jgi:hypothetical protein
MFIGAVGALTGVFACFVNFTSLDTVIHDYANEFGGSRYLFPMLFAWFATILVLCFREEVDGDLGAASSNTIPAKMETKSQRPLK